MSARSADRRRERREQQREPAADERAERGPAGTRSGRPARRRSARPPPRRAPPAPMTNPIADASPCRRPDDPLDDQRLVRPRHLVREERHEVDREDPDGSPDRRDDAAHGPERQRQDAALRHDRRPDLARPERRRARGRRSTARAETRNTADSDQPRPSTRTSPPRNGPIANPIGPAAPKIAIVVPIRRLGTTSRMRRQHDPGVAELEPDQQQAQRELPRLPRQGDAGEHDRLDEAAPDDDRLARVLVGPDAPQRDERRADDEDQRREQPDERQPLGLRARPSG